MEQITETPAWTKVAEIELIYRPNIRPSERPQIRSSAEAYRLLLSYWDENKIDFVEQFKCLLLNRANRVLGIYEASTGGLSATHVDPRLVFAAALKAGASGLLLCHNHPSGNLKASSADIELTQKVVQAGLLLDLPVFDHLIISKDGYFSFQDEGIL